MDLMTMIAGTQTCISSPRLLYRLTRHSAGPSACLSDSSRLVMSPMHHSYPCMCPTGTHGSDQTHTLSRLSPLYVPYPHFCLCISTYIHISHVLTCYPGHLVDRGPSVTVRVCSNWSPCCSYFLAAGKKAGLESDMEAHLVGYL